MKRKHALKGILFILPSFAGVCVFWLLPYVDVIRRSFFGAVNGVFTGFMNYQMIFSNQAFLLAGKNTLRFFGICIPLLVVLSLAAAVLLNGLGEKSEAADENRISASNGHSSCFCGNFMESTL